MRDDTVAIDIFRRLDYTCFPRILHVNHAIRSLILDNYNGIRKARSPGWIEQIPEQIKERVNMYLISIVQHRKWFWESINKPVLTKSALLSGAQIDGLDWAVGAGVTCFLFAFGKDFRNH